MKKKKNNLQVSKQIENKNILSDLTIATLIAQIADSDYQKLNKINIESNTTQFYFHSATWNIFNNVIFK